MSRIISPPNRIIYEKGDWSLYYDPINVKWVKVNSDGKKILNQLELNPSLPDALQHLKIKYNADENTVQEFVTYLVEKVGYLHKGEYQTKQIVFPKKSITPNSLYIHPTYRCNLRCSYCYNNEERQDYVEKVGYNELTVEEYRRLFKQAGRMGIESLVFSGGEPLLRNELFEIAGISKAMGFYNNIITNGTLITKENAASIIKYFDRISVSIDSCITSENDSMRGSGVYERAIRGIKYLRELEGKVTCLGVVHRGNIGHVFESWDYFVNRLGCETYMPQAYISMEEATKELPELDIFVKTYGKMRAQINYWNEIESATSLCNNCGICSGEIAIGADGEVLPCQSLLKEEFSGGNIKDKPLKDILEKSPILAKLRDFTVDDFEECKQCEVKYLCGGSCRANHFNITRDLKKSNRYYCAVNKEIIVNGMFEISSVSHKDRTATGRGTGKVPVSCS